VVIRQLARAFLGLLVAATFALSVSAADRHADPELEALLPKSLGGVALTIESQAGTDLSTNSAAFDAFLKSLGKTRADFVVASASAQGTLRAAVGAWKVKGADQAALIPAFKTVLQASSTTPLTITEEVLSGHPVTKIGEKGELAQGPLYAFARGETLFFVQTPDRALGEEAIGKLW
jgi:hypothetical protein